MCDFSMRNTHFPRTVSLQATPAALRTENEGETDATVRSILTQSYHEKANVAQWPHSLL